MPNQMLHFKKFDKSIEMKNMMIFATMWLTTNLFAQISSPWDGYYEGKIDDTNASLTGETDGDQWNASIDASGYPYTLTGNIKGLTCIGSLTDPQTQASLPFTAVYSSKQIKITIKVEDPYTGVDKNYDIFFTSVKGNSQSSPGSNYTASSNLDTYLVGRWRRTSTYVSGDYSFATDYLMQFDANGVGWYTDGRTVGGGSSSSIDSGSGDVHQVNWKTENKVLWVNYGNGWESHARYFVDGSNLMFTFNNGNKQIWERL
jgi:hypothetical protein